MDYDLCVIGGGINGAGIARDAAGRGLRVCLVEAKDLAAATSSSSTKLIHGGLRYLEYYEFGLVRHSLMEREKLLSLAPHIIWPLQFVLPHDKAQRPAWMIKAGLFLYDRLGGGRKVLPGSKVVNFASHEFGAPLKGIYKKGFVYSDCWVEDARLVVLNAMGAKEKGADIFTRTKCISLQQNKKHWVVGLRGAMGKERSISVKKVINAAGPWVRDVLSDCDMDSLEVPNIKLVKGSHIVIKRKFEGEHAYILQQADKRIVFAIPYERDYMLIGTTEEDYEGDPYSAQISDAEVNYLCAAFNTAFDEQISPENVVWSYSGVRPLFDEGASSSTSATRDYKLHKHKEFSAPLLSIFGGKLTTYRVLAEQAVDKMTLRRKHWTDKEPLPGGDIPKGDFHGFVQQKQDQYSFIPKPIILRYARAYGTRMDVFLDGVTTIQDLGAEIGDSLYEAEVRYLIEYEFARSAEDILWRRSKLGLHANEGTVAALQELLAGYMGAHG